MPTHIHFLLAIVGVFGPFIGAASTVTGKVIDENGKPVAGAEVVLQLNPMGGVFPRVISDELGHFEFKDVQVIPRFPSGWLPEVTASKPEDYLMSPESFVFGFPTGGRVASFSLSEPRNIKNQIVQFGPPGGKLILAFEGQRHGKVDVRIEIARKAEAPPSSLHHLWPLAVAFPLEILMPEGTYEIKLFTMGREYIGKTEVKVKARKNTKALLELPQKLQPR